MITLSINGDLFSEYLLRIKIEYQVVELIFVLLNSERKIKMKIMFQYSFNVLEASFFTSAPDLWNIKGNNQFVFVLMQYECASTISTISFVFPDEIIWMCVKMETSERKKFLKRFISNWICAHHFIDDFFGSTKEKKKNIHPFGYWLSCSWMLYFAWLTKWIPANTYINCRAKIALLGTTIFRSEKLFSHTSI